jgi:hypothetical protein
VAKREKKATVGMRLAMAAHGDRYEASSPGIQSLARRIDAAIKRAVREGYDSDGSPASRERLNTKYGVNL